MKTQLNITTTAWIWTTYNVKDNDYIINADWSTTVRLPVMNNLEQREVIVFDYSFSAAGSSIFVDGNGASVGTGWQPNYEMRHNWEITSFRYFNGTRQVSSSFIQWRFSPWSVLFAWLQWEILEDNWLFVYDNANWTLRINKISPLTWNLLQLWDIANNINQTKIQSNYLCEFVTEATVDTDTVSRFLSKIWTREIYFGTMWATASAWNVANIWLLTTRWQKLYIQSSNWISSDIVFTTQNMVQRAIIASNWNVGIWSNAAPLAALHINKTSAAQTQTKYTNSNTWALATDWFDVGISATGVAELRQIENLDMSFFTNNVQREVITAWWLHGIGVATPVNTLDVSGRLWYSITSYATATVTLNTTTSTAVFTLASAQTITMPAVSTNTRAVYNMVNPTTFAKTLSIAYTNLLWTTTTTLPANGAITIQCDGAIRIQIR